MRELIDLLQARYMETWNPVEMDLIEALLKHYERVFRDVGDL